MFVIASESTHMSVPSNLNEAIIMSEDTIAYILLNLDEKFQLAENQYDALMKRFTQIQEKMNKYKKEMNEYKNEQKKNQINEELRHNSQSKITTNSRLYLIWKRS